MKLELNWYPKGSRHDVPYTAGEGLDHIAFCVGNIDDSFKELVAKGAGTTDFGPRAGTTYCYVKDPDGNWIELYQRSKPTKKKIPRGY